MTPLLSVTTAHVNAPRWAELLIKSVRRFTSVPHEVIVVDNGSVSANLRWLRDEALAGRIRLIENGSNRGHGGAADQGTELALGRYVCHMDIDSFFQRDGWAEDVMALYHHDPKTRIIAKRGGAQRVDARPFGAPIFFYERDWANDNGIKFAYAKGLKGATDSFQAAYWRVADLGYKCLLLNTGEKIYDPTVLGDEIWINGKPTIYHHFYGSRFGDERARTLRQSVDGKSLAWHVKRTEAIFNQPDVKAILASS